MQIPWKSGLTFGHLPGFAVTNENWNVYYYKHTVTFLPQMLHKSGKYGNDRCQQQKTNIFLLPKAKIPLWTCLLSKLFKSVGLNGWINELVNANMVDL